MADGIVTDDEHVDLLQVAELLGLTADHVDAALALEAQINSLGSIRLMPPHTVRRIATWWT